MVQTEHEIVSRVCAAKTDAAAADALIESCMGFIKSETAKFLRRPPREGEDDELSIALLAFYESVLGYEKGRGPFFPFAARAIRSRLIDHFRKEQRHRGHLSLHDREDEDGEGTGWEHRLADPASDPEAHHLRRASREEIGEFSAQLALFGISLSDVADSCPRQERTMDACHRVLAYARSHPALLDKLVISRRLPIGELARGSGVEKKTLERHRTYLVAILLAFTNGYEIIRGHLCRIRPRLEVI